VFDVAPVSSSLLGPLVVLGALLAACTTPTPAPVEAFSVTDATGSPVEATPEAATPQASLAPDSSSVAALTPSPPPADEVILAEQDSTDEGFITPAGPGFGKNDQGDFVILDDMSSRESPGAVWTALSFAGAWQPDGGEITVSTTTDPLADPATTLVRIEHLGGDHRVAVARNDVVVEKVPDQRAWRVLSFSLSWSCVRGDEDPGELQSDPCG